MTRLGSGRHSLRKPLEGYDYVCISCRSNWAAYFASRLTRPSTQHRGAKFSTKQIHPRRYISTTRRDWTGRLSIDRDGDSKSEQTGGDFNGNEENAAAAAEPKTGKSTSRGQFKSTKPIDQGGFRSRGQNRHAKMFLRDLIAKDQLRRPHLDAALAAISKYKNPYYPSDTVGKMGGHFQQKLEHNAAASAALSSFKTDPADRGDRSSGRLLRELSRMHERMNRSENIHGEDSASLSDLPISPKLHPRLSKIRQAMAKKPESIPQEEMTEFERRLLKNPYAHILASDVRMCTVTGARMPKALLTRFALKVDPYSGLPWMVPDGFDPKREENRYSGDQNTEISPFELKPRQPFESSAQAMAAAKNTKPAAADFNIPEMDAEECAEDTVDAMGNEWSSHRIEQGQSKEARDISALSKLEGRSSPGSSAKQQAIDVTGSRAHVIATWRGMQLLSKNQGLDIRFLPLRWRAKLKRAVTDVVVRDQLDKHLKRLMSYSIARQLARLQARGGSAVTSEFELCTLGLEMGSSGALKNAETGSQDLEATGAVLWFGDHLEDKLVNISESHSQGWHYLRRDQREGDDPDKPRSSCVTRVPLYEMKELLGEEELEWLREVDRREATEQKDLFRGLAVIIKAHDLTTKVLSDLWRLQEFMSPGEANQKSCLLSTSCIR